MAVRRRGSTLLLGAIAAAALVMIVAALYWTRAPRAAVDSAQGDGPSAARSASPPAAALPVAARPSQDDHARPASVRGWEGIAADGELRLDSSGRLVIDLALRRRFDHLISARGVLTEQQILDRLLQEAAARGFGASPQEELRQLFESYRGYQAALGTLQPDPTSLGSVRAANLARQQLRRAMLGVPVAEAFFGQDEAEENYALARMEVMQDEGLSPAQRAARLEALLDALPAEVRAMEQETRTLERLDARVAALGAAAADPAAIYAARAELVGAEAAQRLAALDAEVAAWQLRMQKLEEQWRRIRADPRLDAAQQQRAFESYIAGEFTPQEAPRARAHASLLDSAPAGAAR